VGKQWLVEGGKLVSKGFQMFIVICLSLITAPSIVVTFIYLTPNPTYTLAHMSGGALLLIFALLAAIGTSTVYPSLSSLCASLFEGEENWRLEELKETEE